MCRLKVDNAIIMAAGESKRCLPLSRILPKGLFEVKGEVLIEREIRQLQQAGINEIIIIVGYVSERFEYLAEKFGCTIVKNEEYKEKNNVSSIYAARDYLKNSYICCADNYYTENIFRDYEDESYYTCVYTEAFADEYCIKENDNGYIESIKRGGENQWFTIGANFWSDSFSKVMIAALESEYDNPEIWNMLIDDFHIRHFSELPIKARKMDYDSVLEFDTLEEFRAFDQEFEKFEKKLYSDHLYEKYTGVTRYAGVTTDIKEGRLHFNENLWGPSPNAMRPFHDAKPEDMFLYDSDEKDILVEEISQKYGFPYESVILHNSGSELIRSIVSLMVEEDDYVLLPMPHWSYYPGIVDCRFGKKIFYDFDESGDKCYHSIEDILDKAEKYCPKIIIVTSPAMPSGNLIHVEDLEMIVSRNPQSLIYVDQAYFGFESDSIDVKSFIDRYDNIMFGRTFSKFFALAGLRLGYGVASKKALDTLWLDFPLLRLPIVSRRAVIECLKDDEYYDHIRSEIQDVKRWFYNELLAIDEIHPFKSDTNFIFMKIVGVDAALLREEMIKKGFLFRIFEYGGGFYYRINVAPMELMSQFVDEFKRTISEIKRGA